MRKKVVYIIIIALLLSSCEKQGITELLDESTLSWEANDNFMKNTLCLEKKVLINHVVNKAYSKDNRDVGVASIFYSPLINECMYILSISDFISWDLVSWKRLYRLWDDPYFWEDILHCGTFQGNCPDFNNKVETHYRKWIPLDDPLGLFK